MEDEMGETEFDVGTDLLQVLVRVVGDEPAAVSLVCYGLGFAFHLAWVFDARFVFGGERQGSPDTGVTHRTLAVGVEGYFDLDGSFESRRVAASCFCSFLQGWYKLVAVKFVAFAGGADKAVAVSTGELGGNGPAGADVDGDRLLGTVIDGGVAGAVIFSLEGDEVSRPELADEFDGLTKAGQALFGGWPFNV